MKRRRFLNIFLIQFLVFLMLLVPFTGQADTVRFYYDEQGRLLAEQDESGNADIYTYDPVGNILSIDHFIAAASGIGIFLVTPRAGVDGMTIEIIGFGFDDVASNVTFNGDAAAISSSDAHLITVTLPDGATSGSVVVTNVNGTATSPQSFIVLTPTIFSADPERIVKGATTFTVVSGLNLTNPTSISFSDSGLSGLIFSGDSSSEVKMNITVDPSVLPGTFTFSITTSNGVAQGGSLTVAEAFDSFAITNSVSVFFPAPLVQPLEGDSFTVTPSVSVEILQ